MKILFSAFLRENSQAIGDLKKVTSQCLALKKDFDDVYLYLSRESEAVLYKVEDKVLKEIDTFSYPDFATFDSSNRLRKFKSFFRYNSYLTFLSKIIDLYNMDVLYFSALYPINILFNIGRKRDLIKIFEILTYPFDKDFKKTLEYNLFWKNGMKKMEDFADIIVAISFANTLNGDKKFVLISNGIRLEDIKIKAQNKKNFINLLSIAVVGRWHGYDRIIKGLHKYYKNNPKKEVYYHCVGEGPELENLKNLVKGLKLEKYVIFYGRKVGEELDKIVDESDVAFGSLGLHRIGSGNPLKSREYCARGIPFVKSYFDPDFPDSFPFALNIPNDDTPVDIDNVISWYEDLSKNHPDYSLEMRKYAEENLSWDAKMKPVIEKIKELAKERKSKI